MAQDQPAKPNRAAPARVSSNLAKGAALANPTALLASWEGLCKEWTRAQLDSVHLVQTRSRDLPEAPRKPSQEALAADEALDASGGGASPTAATPAPFSGEPRSRRASAASAALGETSVIENTQQFFTWFSQFEEEMEQGQEDGYRDRLDRLADCQASAATLVADLDAGVHDLDAVLAHLARVDERIQSVQASCDRQVEEQTQLLQLHGEIQLTLGYFRDLESVVRLLSAPSDDVCVDPQFRTVVGELDAALAFLAKHPQYRDAETFTAKYRQCMTRAMSLAKGYFCEQIRQIGAAAGAAADPELPFRAAAPALQPLVGLVEARVPAHNEYLSLLMDCLAAYVGARRSALGSSVSEQVLQIARAAGDLDGPALTAERRASESTPVSPRAGAAERLKTPKEILDVTQSGCVFLRQLARDETRLFRLYFGQGVRGISVESEQALAARLDEKLLEHVEGLVAPLYDVLRPLVLHESRIDVLCELCHVLEAHLQDGTAGESEKDTVAVLVQRVLGDAQQRLVFRAQQFVTRDIAQFRVPDQSFELLERARQIAAAAPTPDDAAAFSVGSGGEWYPTVGRTLWVLGKLYACVRPTVFEDVAQDAIEQCRQSLLAASGTVRSRLGALDAQLFLIKNLLLLREHLASAFGSVSFIRRSTTLDVSHLLRLDPGLAPPTSPLSPGVTVAQQGPLSPAGAAGPAGPGTGQLLARLSRATTGIMLAVANPTSVLVERVSDEKKELDRDLRVACEELITDVAQRTLAPVAAFLVKVAELNARNTPDKEYRLILQNQPFATPEQLAATVQSLHTHLDTELGASLHRIRTQLRDRRTEAVLLGVIASNIVETYTVFYQIAAQEYDPETVSGLVPAPEAIRELVCKL